MVQSIQKLWFVVEIFHCWLFLALHAVLTAAQGIASWLTLPMLEWKGCFLLSYKVNSSIGVQVVPYQGHLKVKESLSTTDLCTLPLMFNLLLKMAFSFSLMVTEITQGIMFSMFNLSRIIVSIWGQRRFWTDFCKDFKAWNFGIPKNCADAHKGLWLREIL